MKQFGGMIDVVLGTGSISCKEVVVQYDAISASPALNVAGEPIWWWRPTISIGRRSECSRLAPRYGAELPGFPGESGAGTIPFQQWGGGARRECVRPYRQAAAGAGVV